MTFLTVTSQSIRNRLKILLFRDDENGYSYVIPEHMFNSVERIEELNRNGFVGPSDLRVM